MKLLWILLGLVIHVTSSVPVDAEENKVPNVEEENGEPNKNFVAEVRAYLEEQKFKARVQWKEMQDKSVVMTGNDWTACWGEVFIIYRASGPGQVCVGDLVGVYYPRSSRYWMGCTGSTCPKSSCPGQPTTAHGFATEENWYTCCSEVFKIYASGKANGDVIDSGDDIMLYSLDLGRWVAQDGEDVSTNTTTCAGTTRPPPAVKFDECHRDFQDLEKTLKQV